MAIQIKNGGAYAAVSAVKIKTGGAYVAAAGVFVKEAGVYVRVDAPPAVPQSIGALQRAA